MLHIIRDYYKGYLSKFRCGIRISSEDVGTNKEQPNRKVKYYREEDKAFIIKVIQIDGDTVDYIKIVPENLEPFKRFLDYLDQENRELAKKIHS
ncbi:MAG: hypothetical protein OXR68_06615 [Alphaproteobacteria bacterium]|nr:hypothetical protein [Alphaproteobacteria bacterium]MDD9920276.1 hypothetical protein [Alphaproteobacteria bacterium]